MTSTASRRANSKAQSPSKRGDIQALRGIAVLLVVLFHLRAPFVSGGFVGVDVFFVVSGFLVGGALAREAFHSGRIDFAAFFARRARRILPAGMVTIALVAVVVAVAESPLRNLLWGRPLEEESLAKDALAATAYVPNLWFMAQGREYGATTASSPYLHFWSLGVEEQFYIVAPFAIAIVWLVARKRLRAFTLTLAAVGALSLAYALAANSTDGNIGYFDPLGRAWQLVAGILAALAATHLARRLSTRVATVATVAGFAGIGLAAFLVDGERGWPRWTALLVVAATALVLIAGAKSLSLGPVARPLEWVGDRSYSWYLWHWPLLALADSVTADRLGRVALAGVALVSLVIADQQYRWVERPAMRWPVRTPADRRRVWRRSTAVILLAVTVIVASAAWSHHQLARSDYGRVAPQLADFEVPPGAQAQPSEPHTYVPADLSQPTLQFADTVPANVRPQLADALRDVPEFYGGGCRVSEETRLDPLPECAFGNGTTVVVLFGDSHASQWYPALEPWVHRGAITVVPVIATGCSPVPVGADKSRPGCAEWRVKALSYIERVDPDIVILGSRYQGYQNTDRRAQQLADGMATTIPSLAAQSRVYYILDNPAMARSVPKCALENILNVARCGRATNEAVSAVAEKIAGTAASDAGATYLNFNSYMCNADRCGVVLGDVLLYRDDNHLTQQFVATLWRPFGAAIGLEE